MIEDELNTVPSITLDQEDIEQRQGRRIDSVLASPEKMQSSSSQKVFVGLGALILVALAGVGWLYLALQQSEQQLFLAVTRIEQLEGRLVSTDTTITKSEVLLADKLKSTDQLIETNISEIRKLWGLAGDTQRKAIDQLKSTNDQQGTALKNIQERLANGVQQLDAHQASLDQLSLTAKNSESSAREAVQRMELTQEKMTAIDGDVKNIKQKQTQLEGDYSKRLAALEDTAKSTDVFRRNTQEELRKLREELLRQSASSVKSGL